MSDYLHPQFQRFFSYCSRLDDAILCNLTVRGGLPVLCRSLQVVRRCCLHEKPQPLQLTRRGRRSIRKGLAAALTRIDNGIVPRIRITGGQPVEIWLKEEI